MELSNKYTVSFDVNIPVEATEKEVASWVKFELWVESRLQNSPLSAEVLIDTIDTKSIQVRKR